MRKRKYDAKTGEEWLQHISRYLYTTYHYSECYGGWSKEAEKQAHQIIAALIKKVSDEEKA